MKDCNEIASELFERRDEYVKEKKRRTKRVAAAGVSVLCAAAVAVGVGVWKNADNKKPQSSDVSYSEITVPDADGKKLKVITSYPSNATACYASPENGTFFCTMEVDSALKELKESGEDTAFLVQMWVFHDRNTVNSSELMNECERLSKLGYKFYNIPVWEYHGYPDVTRIYRDQIAGLLTLEQLENFDFKNEYGYFFDFIHNGDSSPVNIADFEPMTFYPTDEQVSLDAPENGSFSCSTEVGNAIKTASGSEKETATFFVRMDVFRDEKAADQSVLMSECERLSKLGYKFYTVQVYELQDGKYVYHDEVAGLLTLSQLQKFDLNTEYGYYFDFITMGDSTSVSIDEDCEPLTF